MTLPFQPDQDIEAFRLAARQAGYTDAEINSYIETQNRNRKQAAPSPQRPALNLFQKVAQGSRRQGEAFNKGFFTSTANSAKALENIAGAGEAAGIPGVSSVAGGVKILAGKAKDFLQSKVPEIKPAPAGQSKIDEMLEKTMGFAGAVAGELPLAAGVSAPIRVGAGKLALKTTNKYAQMLLSGKVPGSFFKSAAASLPLNLTEGIAVDAIAYPEQTFTKEGIARSAALSAIGALGDGLAGMKPLPQQGPRFDPIGEILGSDKAPPKVPFWKKVDSELFDPVRPLKDIGDFQNSDSAYALGRRLAAVEDQIDVFQADAVMIPDGAGYRRGASKPYMKLIQDIGAEPEVLADFDRYLLGTSNLDLAVDKAAAASQITQLDAKYPHFKNVLVEYKKHTDELVDVMRGYGLIDDDVAASWKAEGMYVPTGRVTSSGSSANFMKSKVNTESLREIRSPLQQIYEIERRIILRGETNKVGQRMLTEVALDRDRWKGAIEIMDSNVSDAPIEAEIGRLIEQYKQQGLQPPPLKVLRAQAELNSAEALDGTAGKLRVIDKGIATDLKLGDPMIVEFFKARKFSEPNPVGKVFKKVEGFTTRTFFQPMRELTGKNAFFDQFEAFLNTKWNEYIPGWDFARGVWAQVTNDPRLLDIRTQRGAVTTRYANANLFEDVRSFDELIRVAGKGKIAKHFSTPLQPMHELMGVISSGTRYGAALRKLNQTGNAGDAAMMARNVIADPQQRGLSGAVRALSYSSFANYGLQTVRRTAQAMKENPVTFAIKGLMTISVPTAYFWLNNKDDAEIQDLRKARGGENYWFIRNPQSKEIYAVQKPYLPGQMFGTALEAFLDREDPKNAEMLAKGLAGNLIPNMMPISAGLAMELKFGKNFFGFLESPIPLSPTYSQGALAEDVAGQNTFGISKLLAERSGMDAAQIDNVLKTILFSQATDVYDRIDRKIFDRMAPEAGFTLFPAAKKVNPYRPNTETLNNFYDKYSELKKVGTSFDIAFNEGNMERVEQLKNLYSNEYVQYQAYDTMNEVLGQINNQIRITGENRFLSPEERRERVTNLRKMMISKTKAFNELMEKGGFQ